MRSEPINSNDAMAAYQSRQVQLIVRSAPATPHAPRALRSLWHQTTCTDDQNDTRRRHDAMVGIEEHGNRGRSVHPMQQPQAASQHCCTDVRKCTTTVDRFSDGSRQGQSSVCACMMKPSLIFRSDTALRATHDRHGRRARQNGARIASQCVVQHRRQHESASEKPTTLHTRYSCFMSASSCTSTCL